MTKNIRTRNGSIHLYNPKREGLGEYDEHYINANIKNKFRKKKVNQQHKKRLAA